MIQRQDLKSAMIGATSCFCTLLFLQGSSVLERSAQKGPEEPIELSRFTEICPVFYANHEIPAGVPFTSDMVREEIMEVRVMPANALWCKAVAVGRITKYPIAKGTLISLADFVDFQDSEFSKIPD